jgi:AcrR family transcriptional regulator
MGDVARRAGLPRQTLYRYFPSKDAPVASVVVSETAGLVDRIVLAAAPHDEPEATMTAALTAALRVLRDHPLLDRLLTTEPEALLPLLTTDGGPVMVHVRTVVEQIVSDRTPDVADDPDALRRFADVVTRLLISYAISAPDDPPEVVGEFVSHLLMRGALADVPAEVLP